MKKIYISLLTLTFVCFTLVADGQQIYQQGSTQSDSTMKQLLSVCRRAQNVFVEFGGQGLFLTANFDSYFGNRRNGLGGRIGIGIGPSLDWGVFTKEGKRPLSTYFYVLKKIRFLTGKSIGCFIN